MVPLMSSQMLMTPRQKQEDKDLPLPSQHPAGALSHPFTLVSHSGHYLTLHNCQ